MAAVAIATEQQQLEVDIQQIHSKFQQPHLMIATPCYGDVVHTGYLHGLKALTEVCQAARIGLTVKTLSSDSLIPRARNCMVAHLLSNPQFSHMMFIDADLTFAAAAVLHLMAADLPVVGGAYPKKRIDWQAVRRVLDEARESKTVLSDAELLSKSLSYAVNLRTNTLECQLVIERGFAQVEAIATGFMLIKRSVLEQLRDACPERQFVCDTADFRGPELASHCYNFFECTIDPTTRGYVGEDYSFCALCRKHKIPIYLDFSGMFAHTGNFHFAGCFANMLGLDRLSQQSESKIEERRVPAGSNGQATAAVVDARKRKQKNKKKH